MLKKRQEVERLAASGKHKYEYDSDEDTAEGTWEHKYVKRIFFKVFQFGLHESTSRPSAPSKNIMQTRFAIYYFVVSETEVQVCQERSAYAL